MTEGTPYPPQHPGQPDQPPGGYPPPETPPPVGGYPPPQAPAPQRPATGYPQQAAPPATGYPQPGHSQPTQPGYPQQGYPQQPQQYQPPKKSNAKKILLILALVIGLPLIGIGACTFFFVGLFKGPINESNAMLALLDEGNYQEAYAAFDPSCASGFTAEDLEMLWSGVEIDGYNLNSVNVVNSNADVSGTVSLDGGPPSPISLQLNKRDGDWEVCSLVLQ